jgi:hypothetical protein
MSADITEKRSKARVKQELIVKLKTQGETKQVCMIDLSLGGIKIGGNGLVLAVGSLVEITFVLGRESEIFRGKVERQDGLSHIKRLGIDANTYYIRISESRFPEFVRTKFSYLHAKHIA